MLCYPSINLPGKPVVNLWTLGSKREKLTFTRHRNFPRKAKTGCPVVLNLKGQPFPK